MCRLWQHIIIHPILQLFRLTFVYYDIAKH